MVNGFEKRMVASNYDNTVQVYFWIIQMLLWSEYSRIFAVIVYNCAGNET